MHTCTHIHTYTHTYLLGFLGARQANEKNRQGTSVFCEQGRRKRRMLGVRGDGRAFLLLDSCSGFGVFFLLCTYLPTYSWGLKCSGQEFARRMDNAVGGFEGVRDMSHRPKGGLAPYLTLPTYLCSTPTVPYCNTGGSGVSVQLEVLFFIGRLIPCVSH